MSAAPIFNLDVTAAVRGGAKAGQYLQSIGQTDLAQLNVGQFEQFCTVLVGGAWSAALDDFIARPDVTQPPF